MKWITREQVRVGRMGCAWLIRKYIDPEAEFFFAPGPRVAEEAKRAGATPFHAKGAELSAQGDLSSFEVMLRHYNLTGDPALELLAKIVSTADVKDGPYHQPEGPGLKAVTEGILYSLPDDLARLDAGRALYDQLYAYCERMTRSGKPNGMFIEA